MTEQNNIPKFFSLEFHIRFFPRMLWSRLQPKKEAEGTRFSHDMEFIILLALCLFLAAMGIPMAIKGSWLGWLLGILGIGGILAFIVFCILSEVGTRPSYDRFLIWSFLFFVFLGVSSGMLIGKEQHSLLLGLFSSVSGFFLGYLIGIFAGLWLQYLGWFASIINMLCGFAIFLTVVVDLVLLLR
jgi:hypothetical protein